jgi:hypothetical protein
MYREFGIPARIEKPESREELEELIGVYNGKKSCYTSVYAFDDGKGYESAYINNIWFDFDHKKDIDKCLKDIRKFYKRYCKPNNITPRIYLTGGKGFQMNIDFHSFLDIPSSMKRKSLKQYLLHLKKKYFLSTLDERCINNSTGVWCTQFSVDDMLKLSIEEMYGVAMDGPNETIGIIRSKRAQRDMLDYICDLYSVSHTVSNSADYLYSELYKVAETETSSYPSEGNFTLDLKKLDNVVERGGKTIARCPACASRGRDSHGNHLVIFDNGAYSCIVGDSAHRKEIFRLARKALNSSV